MARKKTGDGAKTPKKATSNKDNATKAKIVNKIKGKKKPNATIRNGILSLLCVVVAIVFFMWQQSTQESVPIPEGEISIHFIDVGQGDSILIQSADHAVLIDAGPSSAAQNIINHLEYVGVSTIDFVVATHPHADHIGSMPGILDRFDVREVWMPDRYHTTATFDRFLDAIERNGLQYTAVMAGDILSAGDIQMTVVAPNSSGHGGLNDYSISLHMQFGQTSFLFTGDMEAISEVEVLEAGWNIQSTVLEVSHHGSRTSTTEAFLDAVNPEIAVISVGAGNRYNHPHREVMDRLYERGIQVLRTDELGTIILVTNGETVYRYN
ncbi:MAG: MBL fold metallo-hydrolase [Defluviitaleaceae bacterium]|nr:MBL fold metallo-hydrolase [Defluviitaleaceae bacterium]